MGRGRERKIERGLGRKWYRSREAEKQMTKSHGHSPVLDSVGP